MKDYLKRLVGVGIMVGSLYVVGLVVLEFKKLFFYFEPISPITHIIGITFVFTFVCGFIFVIADYSSLRNFCYQKKLEDFQ